ncbi:MAG: asparagine synthase (glutamine-hydrolyzing) [Oscillospiraceae bacterium]|jgi:asparagine synthase (glutamine-hydrolysing)|nr:asparagine synthase (glutamine-hydrolyzing) [Oscillospiraceae bacterium]
MCSICGVIQSNLHSAAALEPVEAMGRTMAHRGPDQTGAFIERGAALQHNRLAIIDVENGLQPMTAVEDGYKYTIIYNGELYNTPELTRELTALGARFQTRCDTEVVLQAYIRWGEACPERLNGIFAFAVLDQKRGALFLARDRFGIKPLYYAVRGGRLMFASELKALLAHPDVKPQIDRRGMWELLFLTPVTRIGSGLYKDVHSLEPAHCALWADGQRVRGCAPYRSGASGAEPPSKLKKRAYWKLEARPFEDTEAQAVENTRDILSDAIRRQLVSDVPLCTFLSGGLDSSVVSAVAADQYRREGRRLSTYSFEYENNKQFFKQSLFQPQSDDEYAAWLANELGADHNILTVTPLAVADALARATELRDFPGQADIDSSLYLYCQKVRAEHTVALSGECADEIFGGYPWFYRPEMLEKPFYPWQHDPVARASLFDDSVARAKEGYEWLSDDYRSDLAKCPVLPDDTADMRAARQATWLSTRFFMTSLLERKDRMSMGASLEVRVPFSDHRVLEYVYNVPWSIKRKNDVEKSLLREAMGSYLPDRIRNRKKSPYPKVHNPEYERIVRARLAERLNDKASKLGRMVNRRALDERLNAPDATWFGQLMGRPQLIAWLLQMDWWLEKYNIELVD